MKINWNDLVLALWIQRAFVLYRLLFSATFFCNSSSVLSGSSTRTTSLVFSSAFASRSANVLRRVGRTANSLGFKPMNISVGHFYCGLSLFQDFPNSSNGKWLIASWTQSDTAGQLVTAMHHSFCKECDVLSILIYSLSTVPFASRQYAVDGC